MWEYIQEQLGEDSQHELWFEVSASYDAMLAREVAKFQGYRASDPFDGGTTDDPSAFGYYLVFHSKAAMVTWRKLVPR